MATTRRRVLRSIGTAAVDPRRQQRLDRCRNQLTKSRATLGRWISRLRRSFPAVEKEQRRIARLERQAGQIEQS
jgi:hypothetical protein